MGVTVILILDMLKVNNLYMEGIDYFNLVVTENTIRSYNTFRLDEIKYIKWFDSRWLIFLTSLQEGNLNYFNIWGFLVGGLVYAVDFNLKYVFALGIINYLFYAYSLSFFLHKSDRLNYFFLLNPLILELSSGCLRDVLIIALVLLCFHNLQHRKFFPFFFVLLVLGLLRAHWALFLLPFPVIMYWKSKQILLGYMLYLFLLLSFFIIRTGEDLVLLEVMIRVFEVLFGLSSDLFQFGALTVNIHYVFSYIGIVLLILFYFYKMLSKFYWRLNVVNVWFFIALLFGIINAIVYGMALGFLDLRIKAALMVPILLLLIQDKRISASRCLLKE